MSDSLKQIGIAVGTTIVASFILGIAGYILVVKENQIRIQTLENTLKSQSEILAKRLDDLNLQFGTHIDKLDNTLEKNRSSVDSLKLFVVAAHPDKSHVSLISSLKLQSLSPDEFDVLANGLNIYKKGAGIEEVKHTEYGSKFEKLIQKHELNEIDLDSYLKAVGDGVEMQ